MRQTVRTFIAGIAAIVMLATVLACVPIAAFWEPDRPVSALAQKWAPPPSQFMELRGMRVHYRDEGPRDDAMPIVLLHGTSASLHTWDGWAQALSGQHRVVRMDLPAFGLTGPDPHDDYRIDTYVTFVLAFLDRLGIRQFAIAGNSLGGNIAWKVALAAPQRVQRLVLVDAGGYAFKSESVPLAFRMARMPLARDVLAHILPRSVVERSVRNVYGDPSRVDDALVSRYFDLALREGNRRALSVRVRQIGQGDNAALIKRVTTPTLILWGGRDRLIPPESADSFHRDIHDSALVMFPELGHVPHEEDAAQTVQVVREFLAGRGASSLSPK